MSEIQAQKAEFQMTIQITRKETGKVEEYLLTGTEVPNTEGDSHDDIS